MKFRNSSISYDTRPQAKLLLAAAVISVVLWFIPFAELVTYPFRIFVTFIHEGGHAIAALLTGNSVDSLSVAANASGETYTTQGGLLSQMFVSSAGYIGSMAYGALLLILIRRSIAARAVMIGSAGIVLALTLIYGVFKPLVSGATWSGIPFTLLAGTLLTVGLIAVAKFASARVASFFVSFLAVQLVLNALLDLKTVFFLSSPFAPTVPTDAMNMANATGIPAMFWSVSWIVMSLGILWVAMRGYVAGRKQKALSGMTLDDPLGSFGIPELPSIQSSKTRVTDTNSISR